MLVLLHAPELIRILLTASSATARFLSLAVIVLSLAPLASLYLVFFSMLGMDPTALFVWEEGETSAGQWEATTSVVDRLAGTSPVDWKQLAHNRTALEELFKTVYREASSRQQQQTLYPPFVPWDNMAGGGWLASPYLLQQHWTIVIPWLLTFLLGVVVPLVLSCWSFFRHQRRQRQGGATGTTKRRPLKKIAQHLTKFSKVLTPEDQVVVDHATTTEELRDNEKEDTVSPPHYWILPPPGQAITKFALKNGRQVPGTTLCVVCLHTFDFKDCIVWSPNPACQHCFHWECIGKWMTRHGECPCCRREWVD